jgi:glycosyltransferase involved in cell wall biosynthesis
VAFLPLKDAGANNALLESMASGLPLLATDLPATREYAGTCAEFYAPGNIEECLAKLDQLLSSEAARARLGAAARQRMVQRFAWPVIAERYAELYQEVLGA